MSEIGRKKKPERATTFTTKQDHEKRQLSQTNGGGFRKIKYWERFHATCDVATGSVKAKIVCSPVHNLR